jgi:iron complex transport system ATP-binding protein
MSLTAQGITVRVGERTSGRRPRLWRRAADGMDGRSINGHGERTLLADVDVAVAPGEVVAVVGPNGAGKSTLLRVLAGDLAPAAGTVCFGGRPLVSLDDATQAELRAVVGQAPLLAFDFTAADVVEMGWLWGAQRAGERERVVHEAMSACAVRHLAERTFSSLSGGEQQRVQFARALVQIWRPDDDPAPRWLLLDEPTANLDLAHALALLALARQRAAAGIGVLVILHDLNLAARFADRLLLLEGGRTVAYGYPAAVLEPARLSRVYGTPVHVEHHPVLDRLVVMS